MFEFLGNKAKEQGQGFQNPEAGWYLPESATNIISTSRPSGDMYLKTVWHSCIILFGNIHLIDKYRKSFLKMIVNRELARLMGK